MFRILTAISVAWGVDLYLFDGKYSRAFEQVAILIIQHIWH
jgi:hypothetical protein